MVRLHESLVFHATSTIPAAGIVPEGPVITQACVPLVVAVVHEMPQLAWALVVWTDADGLGSAGWTATSVLKAT